MEKCKLCGEKSAKVIPVKEAGVTKYILKCNNCGARTNPCSTEDEALHRFEDVFALTDYRRVLDMLDKSLFSAEYTTEETTYNFEGDDIPVLVIVHTDDTGDSIRFLFIKSTEEFLGVY